MNIFDLFFKKKEAMNKSASLAKERLQIILARERSPTNSNKPDFLYDMQKDLIEVISKYVHINKENVRISLEKRETYEVIEVNITLPD